MFHKSNLVCSNFSEYPRCSKHCVETKDDCYDRMGPGDPLCSELRLPCRGLFLMEPLSWRMCRTMTHKPGAWDDAWVQPVIQHTHLPVSGELGALVSHLVWNEREYKRFWEQNVTFVLFTVMPVKWAPVNSQTHTHCAQNPPRILFWTNISLSQNKAWLWSLLTPNKLRPQHFSVQLHKNRSVENNWGK